MIKNRVLLIEPDYKNKYPPLGLMKLSTFHKSRGDNVSFFKGRIKEYNERFGERKRWGRVYVSTLFTFQYNQSLEAIRLADQEGMYQERAAQMMRVSRQTFGRIVESAHRKIADALVMGKAIRIEGGSIEIAGADRRGGQRHRCRKNHRGGHR